MLAKYKAESDIRGTNRLLPSTISRHEVLIFTPLVDEHSLGSEIHLRFKVRIRELLLEDKARITKMDNVILRLPRGDVSRRKGLVIADGERLPRHMSNFRGVDGVIKVVVVGEGWIGSTWPRGPILHELVNGAGRHLNTPIQKISQVKVLAPCVREVIVGGGSFSRRWR